MSVTGMDALIRYLGSIKKAVHEEVFEEAAKEWVEQDFVPAARQIVPIDTRELHDSIGGAANPQQVRVFASAPHAQVTEEGSVERNIPAQPYMKPAFDKTRRKLSQRTREALRRRLK
jgi:hypothetical protein